MAAELGILSLTQLQKVAQSQQQQSSPLNPSSTTGYWMWNTKQNTTTTQDDDDSWEVRAFEEDTGNAMGTTWPPRSYTCTFCRREFRSAQALGGHMNVHRRDRARLHQAPPLASSNNHISPNPNSALLIPTQEFVTNGGLCLLYSLPNPNGSFNPTSTKSCMNNSPSTLLSISPETTTTTQYNSTHGASISPTNDLISPCPHPSVTYRLTRLTPNITTSPSTSSNDFKKNSSIEDELDLELRLGWRSSSP